MSWFGFRTVPNFEGRAEDRQVEACSMLFARGVYSHTATLALGDWGRQRSLEQARRCHGDCSSLAALVLRELYGVAHGYMETTVCV